MTIKGSDDWQAEFREKNLKEAREIDRYIRMMPDVWWEKICRDAQPAIDAGNRVARRYRRH